VIAESDEESVLFPERVGDLLRASRLTAGMDLSDIATKTRIPLRHLTAIETSDYNSLPSPTYSIGFVKAFARAVGADEVALASALRIELGQQAPEDRYEPSFIEDGPGGPIPTRKLAITAAIIGVAIVGAYLFWFSPWAIDRAALEPETEQIAEPTAPVSLPNPLTTAQPAANAQASSVGDVILTAKDKVWLRIYDANDKVLFEKEMAAGERYSVPGDANNPMIRTGRADLIGVTVAGREVAALGPAERTVKDVGVSAKALAERTPTASLVPATDPVSATSRP
jgi:cytoskeleton protein RodZ